MRGLLITAAGFALLALGVLAALPLPELGVPLVLAGLRLLGRRYAWARRANAWVDRQVERARARFRRIPRPLRWFLLVALAAAFLAAIWFLLVA